MSKESFPIITNIKESTKSELESGYLPEKVNYNKSRAKRDSSNTHSLKEAMKSVKILGITTQSSYNAFYHLDRKLPSSPRSYYDDFPGWRKFTGTEFYESWEKSVKVAKKMGINSFEAYDKLKYKDPGLRSNPWKWYEDFTWDSFSKDRKSKIFKKK